MMRFRRRHAAVAVTFGLVFLAAASALAQSAAIEGRIVDEQSAAVPGVTITLIGRQTGFSRTAVSDSQGAYRMSGIPVGAYDVTAALGGFATVEQRDTVVDLWSTVRVDFTLRVAPVAETVNVAAASPLLQRASAAFGGVVDQRRIAELPLNGRQVANLAATLPGVGIGFHRDPTKSSEYMPQVSGGNGRNVGYVVDGGDNTDDTVGGPLQQFPLDAIDEFRFSIASYSAEQGRASGGVMSVVTKSGTNQVAGSAFTFSRDDALNSRTTTETRADVSKPDYRRWQYGGSLGGPVIENTVHFFGAVERVQQRTFQAVDTQGLFPSLNGVYPVAYREILLTAKLTMNIGTSDRLAFRYGLNTNAQPEGVGPRRPVESWGDNRNRFHSLNGDYGHVFRGTAFNEVVVQVATFANSVTTDTTRPTESFPNGVVIGRDPQAPQATQQRQLQVKDDISLHIAGHRGVAHEVKAGGSFTYEPELGSPALSDTPGIFFFTHLSNDPLGPVSSVLGNTSSVPVAFPELNIQMKRASAYVQDAWRATNRLTVNAGVRYDLASGYALDQSRNPNFGVVQQAAQAGRFRDVLGFEDFGQTPREDRNNLQPRIGFALDLHGTGVDVIRGGWGLYTDAAFTNNNILFAAYDARGSISTGQFSASNPNGLRKPDGTFFLVGDPITTIAAFNEGSATGLLGEVISPRFEQPYTRQTSVGWSHQLGPLTSVALDFIHADGRDLSLRLRLNSRPTGGPRRFADLPLNPNSAGFRIVTSGGESQYDALLLSVRRRSANGIDLAASYTLSDATSLFGQAVDETGLGANTILDVTNPFAAQEFGPANADARHRVSASAIVPLPWALQVAPIVYFRSALPVTIIEGVDRNTDFVTNDLPDRAFAFDGAGRPARDIGACSTINCGRGASFSQMNVRLSRRFATRRGTRVDVIGEIFNLFNASNPAAFNARRLLAAATSNPDFMQPVTFAGDFQQSEQRVGQVGVRVTFGR